MSFIDIALQWIENNCVQFPYSSSVQAFQKAFEPSSSTVYIWEGTASDLIELAVALEKAKLIRKPTGEPITYSEIVKALQRIFGIKIANISSRKSRTLERKKNASPLLERMLALYKQEVEKVYQ